MDLVVAPPIANEQAATAGAASSGPSPRAIHGGRNLVPRRMVLALAGHTLGEHENRGEVPVQVLAGWAHLSVGEQVGNSAAGHSLTVSPRRHSLVALDDSAILLTVATAIPNSG